MIALDRSLAFTALLDMLPGFGQMEAGAASALVGELVADFRASGHPVIWDYASDWIARRTKAAAQ